MHLNKATRCTRKALGRCREPGRCPGTDGLVDGSFPPSARPSAPFGMTDREAQAGPVCRRCILGSCLDHSAPD